MGSRCMNVVNACCYGAPRDGFQLVSRGCEWGMSRVWKGVSVVSRVLHELGVYLFLVKA